MLPPSSGNGADERVTVADLALDYEEGAESRFAHRARLARYGFGSVTALVAFVTMLVFVPVVEEPQYALLVGAVAVTVWYGGLGPGVFAVTIGWSLTFVVFVGDPATIDA